MKRRKIMVGFLALVGIGVVTAVVIVAWPTIVERWQLRRVDSADLAAQREAVRALLASGSGAGAEGIAELIVKVVLKGEGPQPPAPASSDVPFVPYIPSGPALDGIPRAGFAGVVEKVLGKGESRPGSTAPAERFPGAPRVAVFLLRSTDGNAQRIGRDWLYWIGSPSPDFVREVIADGRSGDASSRIGTIIALGRFGREDPTAIAALCRLLHDPSPLIAATACHQLLELPPPVSPTRMGGKVSSAWSGGGRPAQEALVSTDVRTWLQGVPDAPFLTSFPRGSEGLFDAAFADLLSAPPGHGDPEDDGRSRLGVSVSLLIREVQLSFGPFVQELRHAIGDPESRECTQRRALECLIDLGPRAAPAVDEIAALIAHGSTEGELVLALMAAARIGHDARSCVEAIVARVEVRLSGAGIRALRPLDTTTALAAIACRSIVPRAEGVDTFTKLANRKPGLAVWCREIVDGYGRQ